MGKWRRTLREGREISDVKELTNVCENFQFGNGENGWKWELESSGHFNVVSLRKAVDYMQLSRCGPPTLWIK